MLTRDEGVASPQEYYANSLLTVPSAAHTIFNSFGQGVVTPIVGMNDLDSTFAQRPEGKAIHNALDMVDAENSTPGMGFVQSSANYVANILGQMVNPITWGFGEIGNLVAKGISTGAEKVAPDAVSVLMRKPINSFFDSPLTNWIPSQVGKEGEEKALSTALISDKTLQNFGIGAGVSVPSAIDQNFNVV